MKMNRWIQQLWRGVREESGNTAVIVALSLVSLFGFTALAVDGGSMYLAKSKLQKELDASVLAGAQKLAISQSAAVQQAIQTGGKNSLTLYTGDFTTGTNYIEVQKTVSQDLTFAKVLGFDKADVYAVARAQVGWRLKDKTGVVPVGIPSGKFVLNQTYQFNLDPGEDQKGNYQFLAIDGTGASTLSDSIQYGSQTKVSIGDSISTKPGLNWNQVRDAFQYRIDQDASKSQCQSATTADDTCQRVIIAPITDYAGAHGNSNVTILGFAAFWIDSIVKQGNQHHVNGKFISLVTPGDFDNGSSPYGVMGIKLVK